MILVSTTKLWLGIFIDCSDIMIDYSNFTIDYSIGPY